MSCSCRISQVSAESGSEKKAQWASTQISVPSRWLVRSSIESDSIWPDCTRASSSEKVVGLSMLENLEKSRRSVSGSPAGMPSSVRSDALACRIRPSNATSAMPIEACVKALWNRRSLTSSSCVWRAAWSISTSRARRITSLASSRRKK